MNVNELVRRVQVLRSRPSRLADALREPRPVVRGGKLSNALGLQALRASIDHAAWCLRPARVDAEIREAYTCLQRDGVVVIPDFLPAREFDLVRSELRLRGAAGYGEHQKKTRFGQNYELEEVLLTDWPQDYPACMRLLRDNQFVAKLASAVARRRASFRPHVSLHHIVKPEPDAPHHDLDYNQFLHSDRHYPFLKVFFYVSSVDSDSAPYAYAKRSHRVSLPRLAYEYKYSLAHLKARGRRYARTDEQLARDEGLLELANRYVRDIGSHAQALVGGPNTLVLSNNMGFHRRNPMGGRASSRLTVNMDFKYLESPAHLLFPILKHLYNSDAQNWK